ncbi:MAG: FAD-dependent oxidoreductase [Armatimonadetes bacterium]|nr:FAD-dependent oxidoreductase [Armatimonadota bacterium]
MSKKSFWLEGIPFEAAPSLQRDLKVDVAVVGGGFAGLSTAWYLLRKAPGIKVVVLEAESTGFGASGRNAGFAMTLFGLALAVTVLRFGKQKAREAHEIMSRAVDHVGELVEKHGVECDYEKTGLLTVATSPAYLKRLQGEIRLAEQCGIEGASWIGQDEVRARVDSPTYLGARWEPHSALINPARLVLGLRRLAEGAGAEIYEQTPVLEIDRSRPGAISVLTPGGRVTADRVVMATNAWSSRFAEFSALQFPVYTYIVLTQPLNEKDLAALKWHRREGIEDARCLIHYYRLTPDNRLLMGGSDAFYYMGGGFGTDRNEDVARRLRRDAREIFPALQGVRFTHTWGGPVSVPIDFAPAFGYALGDRRLIYSLGCVGHGVALMSFAGKILSDLALDRKGALSEAFFVNRFVPPTPPDPLRWLVVQAIRGGMHLLDAIDDRQ